MQVRLRRSNLGKSGRYFARYFGTSGRYFGRYFEASERYFGRYFGCVKKSKNGHQINQNASNITFDPSSILII